jgi:hypothetical protein
MQKHRLLTIICVCFSTLFSFGQNLKLEVLSVETAGDDGDMQYFAANIKVISGKLTSEGNVQHMAIPLPNGTIAFAYLESYYDVAVGQKTPGPISVKVAGGTLKVGQQLVSPDLAVVKIPDNRSFSCKTNYAFLGETNNDVFAMIGGIKGFAKVGDEIIYTNDRSQKGSGKIVGFEIKGGYKTDRVFEGIADNIATVLVKTNGIDLSNTSITLGKMTAAATPEPKVSTSKHRIQSIPVNAVLEDKNVKITVHNLVKFNPDSTDGSFDVFKVDYTLDYYIVDATFENKTDQPLDAGEYLLRFNFFAPDGKSADEFLRLFRSDKSSKDEVKKDADAIDLNVFGGTSKIPLAGVIVKYQETLPDYDTKHKPQAQALYKPLAAKQKIRSVDATIMGVPPSYKIEGLGTWSGTFFEKKKLIFAPIKL